MDWKEFFKPTKGKVILFLVLIIGLNYIAISIATIPKGGDAFAGVPLNFYPIENGVIDSIPGASHIQFSTTSFILDALFWYAVSCSITFTIKYRRNR